MGSKRKSKKRKIETAETSDEDAGIYTVELILKARVPNGALQKNTGRQWEYYVKWAGYDSDANTWEPALNLEQCDRLVESFWDDIGRDNEDHPEGTECVPSSKWIAMEKNRFWHNLQPHERRKYEQKEAERRAHTQQRRAFEAAGTVPQLSSPEITESAPSQPKRKKKKHKRPRLDVPDSDTSDIPLAVHQKSKAKKRRVTEILASSSDGQFETVNQRRLVSADVATPVASDHELVRQQEQLTEVKASPLPDKGKEKAVEESRPDSPSSLFSVDSSEEVTELFSPKPFPAPEPKSSFMASSSKTGSAKPSPIILSKVPRRGRNTRNTLTESPIIPSANVSSGIMANVPSGISTKQRLAQLALAPVNPKEPNKPLPPKISTNPYGQMRFKKQPTWLADGSTVESPTTKASELTLNALNASLAEQSPSHIFPELHPVDSPISMEPPDSSIMPQPTLDHVDDFLSSITPLMPGFNSPLEPAPEPSKEPKPPPNLVRKASTLPKITKKWKWEKELFILRPDGDEELVGSVVCTNLTQAKTRGMRIHLTFDSMDRLTFLSFHDLSDVPSFLEACKSPDQFGTLSPLDAGSSTKFQVIARYMAQQEKVVLVPVWYEKNLVGHVMILSPTFGNLLKQLEAPPEITGATDSLIVSLHSWKLFPATYQQESLLDLSDLIPAKTDLASTIEDSTRAQEGYSGIGFDYVPTLRTNFKFHFAFRALKFPPDLFAWLTSTRRLYAIHHEYEKGDDRSEPIESQMLKAILKECQAQEGKHQDPKKELRLRVVFIHVGSIRNFHRSSLSYKRISMDIRFYSYGTDSIMPREMWGVREIYPIGGIVTFYPSAFIDDYFGTIKLIRKLHEHPLWMAFISPICLGYIANHAYKGQDALVLYERDGFIYQNLLRLIADGEISLMTAPPLPTATAESTKSWVRNHCRITSPLDALSIGTAAFNSTCANHDQNEWVGTVQHAVDRDIVTIQQQPAIIYEYRRFVVIKGERDQSDGPTSTEASTPPRFNFQDDFFKRKS